MTINPAWGTYWIVKHPNGSLAPLSITRSKSESIERFLNESYTPHISWKKHRRWGAKLVRCIVKDNYIKELKSAPSPKFRKASYIIEREQRHDR